MHDGNRSPIATTEAPLSGDAPSTVAPPRNTLLGDHLHPLHIPDAATVLAALKAAENAGIPVSKVVINDAQQYLKMILGKYEEKDPPGQNRSRPFEVAAALACFIPFGKQPNEWCAKWLKYCQSEIPVGRDIKHGRDELIHYYYAQAVFSIGVDSWDGYRTSLFDHLQSGQNKDGSWPASDGLSVGPVYSTAVWCTILQLDKRSHPSTRWVYSVK